MSLEMQDKGKSWYRMSLYLAMFFMGSALFLYEVVLTRFFSVILSSNLVFLVVSFAILGSGIGAIWVYWAMQKDELMTSRQLIMRFSIWLPISILFSIGAMYSMPFIKSFTIYAVIGAIPFLFGGMIISSIFRENSHGSSMLYFMDLVGSAIGSLASIQVMGRFGFLKSVIVICLLAVFASVLTYFYYGEKKRMGFACIGLLILAAVFLQGELINKFEQTGFNAYYKNPNKIIGYLKDTKEAPLGISFTKWDGISRTDVIETTNRNEKIIATDGGGAAPMIKFNGDLNTVQYMKRDVNFIPFSFGKNEKTLVIGSGGGKDVLFALLGGNKEIHAVEINGSTIKAVNEYKEFNGDIYNRPEVDVHNQDGRNYIENSKGKYDNIYLSMVMTNAIENTAFSLSENYIYTYEAFQAYFNHLNENGKLSFMTHSSFDLAKVINTGIKALLDRGVPQSQVTDYFVVINGMDKQHQDMHEDKISMPLVIFKNQPFIESEVLTIKSVISGQSREILHYPGGEDGLYGLLKNNKIDYAEIIKLIPFNAAPTVDNKPFFYNYSKLFPREIIYVFIGASLLWLVIRLRFVQSKEHKHAVQYFMGLGMAFMLVEIPIIQKMILYFGNPSLAFSVILFSILISCGIGSSLSGSEIVRKFTEKSPIYLLSAGIMILITQLNMGRILDMTTQYDGTGKILVGFMIVLPMGILMGIPFPTGLSKLKALYHNDEAIPLMWGVNGIFSVIGSTAAIMISMKFGFNTAIFIGATIYILLFIVNPLHASETCSK
ncbi:MAG: hypothetical protein ACOYVK_14815 [Bacillota bacterium]